MAQAHLNPVIASHLVEIKAEENPDTRVYVFERGEHGEDVITYRDLHEKANRLARLLLEKGIKTGDTFGVFMRNYPEFVYSLVAGTTIGAIMVPIDPRSRGDRLKYLLTNSGAKAVIVSIECLEQLEEVLKDVPDLKFIAVAYQRDLGMPVSPKYHALNETLEKDTWETVDQMIMDVRQPMEIIYTSGTTGDPKGVAIRNNRTGLFNILNMIVWKYKKDDILYNGLSLTHGNAQAVTLFPALALGITAVFSPRFTKSRIWDICRKYGCTSFSSLGGMLAGIILSGQLLAVFMNNAGGAWDNAKKLIEDEPKEPAKNLGKGSERHKAGVVGDTVGDPMKDTAGPALNTTIQVAHFVA